MVAGDGDDNDEHEDQQPSGHRAHDNHQHVLHDLGPWLSLCTAESLDISIFFAPLICYLSKCATLTAPSSTCHANLHLGAPLSHAVPRQAPVGAPVRHAEGSSKFQRPVGVADDSLRQLTIGSESREEEKIH